ncbi:OB fold-containing protein [Tieghemostelium lacteum]|uniref:OB fold-containing protein n=1 Tax=Tieghemostelium lacteum TaxID=361077 RepID=A0A152A9T8_TIELA|nr:OB fold-containing protein [Tieghemostelium lacteum]|eukprot:KYR02986.1 OB fold-containing protein [Tieghemostelium lacteum]
MNLPNNPPNSQLPTQNIRIIDIKPFARNLNLVFIVVDKGPPIKRNEGGILYQVLVADQTACINMTLFDAIGDQVQPGDILRLRGGYATIYKEILNLYAGKTGIVEKINEFTMQFTENNNLSAQQWILDPITKNFVPKGAPPQQSVPSPFKMAPKQMPPQQQQQPPK